MDYTKYTFAELNQMRVTKGELFAELRKDTAHEFDYALPQDWLNEFAIFCEKHNPIVTYHLIRSTTVWVYPESAPMSLCIEVDAAIDLWSIAVVNGWDKK